MSRPRRAVALLVAQAPTPDVCPSRLDGLVSGWWSRLGRAPPRRGCSSTTRSALGRVGRALAPLLPQGWRVETAVREGRGSLRPVLRKILAAGIDELVVVPMHPHFTPRTTGAIVREVYRTLARHGRRINVAVRTEWHDDAGYVYALAKRLAELVAERGLEPGSTRLCFTAPAVRIPRRARSEHTLKVRTTARLVSRRLGWPLLRTGPPPEEEPGPSLVCALPFGEPPKLHVDIEGIHTCPCVVTDTPFLVALRDLVLHGVRPEAREAEPSAPLLERTREAPDWREDMATDLLMVGISTQGALGAGRGPAVRFSRPDAFAASRRARRVLLDVLGWIRQETPALEALVWSTCQRVELYAWLPADLDARQRDGFVERVASRLFGAPKAGLEVNVLDDAEARHHLARTACGLNSELPGDSDVVAQLRTAWRISRCGRAAGPRSEALVSETLEWARAVTEQTSWGRFSTGYCRAVLERVCEDEGLEFSRLRHVVIGGSTTSRSVLLLLRDVHGVPQRNLTVAYRDHHGQMKQLRAAVGGGRRLRVHDYADERVLSAIADADVVFFGIDQPEPVLDARALRELRDFGRRPLLVVDFNSFGSVSAADLPAGVRLQSGSDFDQAVAAWAAIQSSRSGFEGAVDEAEAWIADRLGLAAAKPC